MSNVKILGRINQTQVAGAETARLILKEKRSKNSILKIHMQSLFYLKMHFLTYLLVKKPKKITLKMFYNKLSK